MSSSHTHRGCGGEVYTYPQTDPIPFEHVSCVKCGAWWSSYDFEKMDYEKWKKNFVGFHPQYEREEVLVEVEQGKKAFFSVRKRGTLNSDGTLKGEEGKWRPAVL